MAVNWPLITWRRRDPAASEFRRLADLARDQGKMAEASVWYRNHLEDHPADLAIWVQFGNSLKDTGRPQDALGAYWQSLLLGGANADCFLQIGHAYKVMGRTQEAFCAYRCSVALQADGNPAAEELANLAALVAPVSASSVKPPVANWGAFRKLLSKFFLSAARAEGDRRRDRGQWSDAAVSYRRHLRKHPSDFLIWVQLGNCLKEAGSSEESLDAYWHAVALDCRDADVFLQLGHLHKISGRPADAVIFYRISTLIAASDNPATTELSGLGGSADWGLITRYADLPTLQERLETLESQLERLIEDGLGATEGWEPQRNQIPAPTESPPVAPAAPAPPMGPGGFILVVEPTHHSDPGSIGQLVRALLRLGVAVRLTRWCWDEKMLLVLNRDEARRFGWPEDQIDAYPGPERPGQFIDPSSCGAESWLVVPEPLQPPADETAPFEVDIITASRRLGLRSAFIFSGAEPLRQLEHRGAAAAAHEQYMQALLLADLVLPTSALAESDLKRFFIGHQKAAYGPRILRIEAPSEFGRSDNADGTEYARRLVGAASASAQAKHAIPSLYYLLGVNEAIFDRPSTVWLLRAITALGIDVVPAIWDTSEKKLTEGTGLENKGFGKLGGLPPMRAWREPGAAGAPPWLLHPGVVSSQGLADIAAYARSLGLRAAAIIPEAPPSAGADAALGPEMETIFEALTQFDKVLAASQRDYKNFYAYLLSSRAKLLCAEDRFKLVKAADETPDLPRRVAPASATSGLTHVLTWSHLEAGENIAILADRLSESASLTSHRVVLTVLAGDDCSPSHAPPHSVHGMVTIRWLSPSYHDEVEQAFAEADFAIVPGEDGGASAQAGACRWRGIPCVVDCAATPCHDPSPGQLSINLADPNAFAEAMRKMMDVQWRETLAYEAIRQPARPWTAYAADIIGELASDRLADGLHLIEKPSRSAVYGSLINLNRRPKLSVCISTYNRAGWLGVNLRNIFTQLGEPRHDVEVLVVDNASLDDTSEVVKPYLHRPDFSYLRNRRNVGMLGNLAVTAQRARGDYIWILGDDDLTRPGVIDRVLKILHQNPDLGLIYMNYGYTTEADPNNVVDLDAFLAGYNTLEPPGPDELSQVKHIAAKCENFYTAIYCHVYRRDHGLKSYCQDTSGRIFSTMLSCVPTAYYVLNYMADEPAYWIGEPSLVVNSNVSWQAYGTLLDLEQLPRTWDLAERMGTDPEEVDRRRANRLWLVELMWKEIFEADHANNSPYFSPARVIMRLKHLPELEKHIPAFRAAYDAALQARHPAANLPSNILFAAYAGSN